MSPPEDRDPTGCITLGEFVLILCLLGAAALSGGAYALVTV